LSVSDRQPTWHNRPDERKLQVQLIFPKNLWPTAKVLLVIFQKCMASVWIKYFKI
jgi:hypothetical protein